MARFHHIMKSLVQSRRQDTLADSTIGVGALGWLDQMGLYLAGVEEDANF